MTLLVARGLSAAPPGAAQPVLRDTSIELDAGEWLAVSGPNGGGKSTLAMVLAGLWPATAGTIEFDGEAFEPRPSMRAREAIAVIFQDPAAQLLESTVADELLYSARNLGRLTAAREVAERWIAAFDLGADLGRDPRTLSAGRQQIVLLGAALAACPRLLIADEPAAHLDARTRAAVLARVREEVENGLGVLWVTQDAGERVAADRTIWVGDSAARPPAAAMTRGAACAPALTLEVAPWNGGDGPAIRNAEAFEIRVGARGVTALTGPNGSGKSVLLQIAVGVMESDQCRATWHSSPSAPPILASQFPDEQIFEENVGDELIYAAVARGVPRAKAIEAARAALERLGIPAAEFMLKRCWWLSGGEKRLVSTVAALIAPAGLVALDEPTAGLDAERRDALQVLVNERSSRDAVLVASQDLDWVEGWEAITLGKHGAARAGLPSTSKKTD
jgi:energy-coupling factor transporter ATP-binding protein EcfA2